MNVKRIINICGYIFKNNQDLLIYIDNEYMTYKWESSTYNKNLHIRPECGMK